MDIEKLGEILKELPQSEKNEETIFGAGGRNYFENPTTDLLAFFARSDSPHGFSEILVSALLSFFEGEERLSIGKVIAERELRTTKGGRIDLFLESSDWVLVIENKIKSNLKNNDLNDYCKSTEEDEYYKDKTKKFFMVLAPSNMSDGLPNCDSWISVSVTYEQLLSKLEEYFDFKDGKGIFKREGKWGVFFREFYLHLKEIAMPDKIDEKARQFAVRHFKKLKEASDLKNSFIDDLQDRLEKYLSGQLNFELQTRLHNWPGGTVSALRYQSREWNKDSDVVLCLDCKNEELKLSVRLYAGSVKDVGKEIIREKLGNNLGGSWRKGKESWAESKGTILAWEEFLNGYDYEDIKEKMLERIKLLDEFEKARKGV